jgi:hypothetical protein
LIADRIEPYGFRSHDHAALAAVHMKSVNHFFLQNKDRSLHFAHFCMINLPVAEFDMSGPEFTVIYSPFDG